MTDKKLIEKCVDLIKYCIDKDENSEGFTLEYRGLMVDFKFTLPPDCYEEE